MQRLFTALLIVAISLFAGFGAHAQYKAPSEYFPKNRPVPGAPGGQPSAPKPPPAAPEQPKFKDVAVNSQFYFRTDTNRAHAWIKVSATTARNNKSGTTQVINGETPVQR